MVARDIFTYKTKSACQNNSAFGKYDPNLPRFKQTSKKSTIKVRIIQETPIGIMDGFFWVWTTYTKGFTYVSKSLNMEVIHWRNSEI